MIARLISRMPPAAVYFVRPARIALFAASLMLSGVSKSGSPAPKSQTFAPEARNASAACIAAIVADDCMRATFSEMGNDDIAGQVFILRSSSLSFVSRRVVEPNHRQHRRGETLL